MKFGKLALLFICLLFTSCSSTVIRDNEIVVVNSSSKVKDNIKQVSNRLNIEGVNRFASVQYNRIQKQYKECAVVTESPDGSAIFLAEKCNDSNSDIVLMGDELPRINLIRLDTSNLQTKVICYNIKFINVAKWNSKGNVVAFCGGEEIRIYNNETGEFLFKNETQEDAVTYFGWSPDGDKLYTEHPNMVNGNIYYLDMDRVVYPYEAKENIYYRGILNNEYYYAASMVTASKISGVLQYKMLIVNNNGNVVYEGENGRFRDSYENEMLYIGTSGAELYYYPDINDMGNRKLLSLKFIHDVKFVSDGKIAYIDSGNDVEKNDYTLHILDNTGVEITSMKVSGAVFVLSPDGSYGWIGGEKWEKIYFKTNDIVGSIDTGESQYDITDRVIFKTIRGVINIQYMLKRCVKVDEDTLKEYFIDTSNPCQEALTDMKYKLNSISEGQNSNIGEYDIKLYLKNYTKYKTSGCNRVSVNVYGVINSSDGSETAVDRSLELIEQDGSWYVTGVGTFPQDNETSKIASLAEDYAEKISKGIIFDGILKDMDLQIGQIQFWDIKGQNIATSINKAGYCKIYLSFNSDGENKVYKLILKKNEDGVWTAYELLKDNLQGLL